MAEIYMVDINEPISNDLYQQLFNYVSNERKARVNRYKFEADAKRSLYAGVLVNYLVCTKLHLKKEEVHLEYNEYGKPYLSNSTNQFFNISHSGKWVVCAWSNKEIGVDIQQIEAADLDIARRFFLKEEYLSIAKLKGRQQAEAFYTLWTLKESYIKYKGRGLAIPLNSFQLIYEKEHAFIRTQETNAVMLHMINIDEEHKLAVCTEDSEMASTAYMSLETVYTKLDKLHN